MINKYLVFRKSLFSEHYFLYILEIDFFILYQLAYYFFLCTFISSNSSYITYLRKSVVTEYQI